MSSPISSPMPVFPLRNPNVTRLTFRPGTRQIWLGLEGETGGGAGSSSSAAATSSSSSAAGTTDSKPDVSFSADQQAKVQEIVDSTYAKAAAKTEAKVKAEMAQLQAEITKLKGDGGDKGDPKPGEKPKGDGKDEKTYTKDQLEQTLRQAEERWEVKLGAETKAKTDAEERALKLLEKDRRATIVSAAAKALAIDPEEVADLTLRHVAHDDEGGIIVLNEKGGARLGPKGDPLTVEEFVRDWVEKRPHHKRGSGTGGAGSGTDGKSGQADPAKMTPTEKIAAGLAAKKG